MVSIIFRELEDRSSTKLGMTNLVVVILSLVEG